jgi:hypothetical protein
MGGLVGVCWGLLQVCGSLQILEGFCICEYENLKFGI